MPANSWANDASAVRQYFINNLGLTGLNNLPTLPAAKTLSDLITFYNNPPAPSCSHSDYDVIKTERDQLKTDKDNHQCDCDSKVAAKEKEIITKIITDLSLSTERERERERTFWKP